MARAELQKWVELAWPELYRADCDRNAGMPMEMLSVEGYAGREGLTPEQYIIKVLRDERDRRQAVDEVARKDREIDEFIDLAAAAGVSVLDLAINRVNSHLPPELGILTTAALSRDFLLRLSRRLEERLNCAPERAGRE